MSDQGQNSATSRLSRAGPVGLHPVSSQLIERGLVSPAMMLDALAQSAQSDIDLERILIADSRVYAPDMMLAQARHWGVTCLDPVVTPPDPAVADLLDPAFCLRHGVLPWRRVGQTLVIATARPSEFQALRRRLPAGIGPLVMALALDSDLQALIAARHGQSLADAAETWVAADESCRDFNRLTPARSFAAGTCALTCLAALALVPALFFAAVISLAVATLLLAQLLKVSACLAGRNMTAQPLPPRPASCPTVSLLVPLFHEDDIAATLVTRLGRIDYPRALLDVILVLEAGDSRTRAALDRAKRPPWMRVVEVPQGTLTTKPRALNYALNFCRGDIIGIYDAEDAPAANQIDRVVDRFAHAPDNVACLQGILDFYNPRANWLSRCFAIEYATWFRILLPGLARLGFAIPLGGTTVFFRRAALEAVRGWDAHNVTEDADLGIRLARHGYVTELLPTVTREEANNRLWPWVKQRSRWLKGYMITYAVHTRHPLRLLRQLGAWKFLGFQVFFLTAILQFLLAPALWSFWLVLFGLPHPLAAILEPAHLTGLLTVFLLSEAASLIIGFAAVARSPHDGLMLWVPTMAVYFPLGVIAAYKALYELVVKPFYWDKTAHGHSLPDTARADREED